MIADYGCYRPQGQVTFEEAVHLIATAIEYARDRKVKLLFVDSTKLIGFASPGTWDRFWMGVQLAASGHSVVKLALMARPELIDPQHFGVTVARNRGLLADVFTTERDALTWLLDPQAE